MVAVLGKIGLPPGPKPIYGPCCHIWATFRLRESHATRVSKYGQNEYVRALNASYTFQPLMGFWFNLVLLYRTLSNRKHGLFHIRGCLHDTGATFAPRRVHSGSLSWLYICLHDTATKSHPGESRPGVSSLRLSHRGENFTPVRNLATVSCKHETTRTPFGVKSV